MSRATRVADVMAKVATTPAVLGPLSNEERWRLIEAKVDATLRSDKPGMSREEMGLLKEWADRAFPKKEKPEAQLTKGEALRIADIYDTIFAGEYCDKCGRGKKP